MIVPGVVEVKKYKCNNFACVPVELGKASQLIMKIRPCLNSGSLVNPLKKKRYKLWKNLALFHALQSSNVMLLYSKLWNLREQLCLPFYISSKNRINFVTCLRNEMPATQRWYRSSSYIKNYSNLITELRQANLRGKKKNILATDVSSLTLDWVK